ncbi:MAG: AAA family ATPase [Candidatus Methylomirabilia bacterium]
MYLDAFGFSENPFGVTPDPRFFYLGRTHEQALSSLCYGIEQRQGFVMVTGEVGTGKTLLCRALLDRLGETTSTALILNPSLEPLALLRAIVADFGIAAATGEKAALIESLNLFLLTKLRRKEHVVLIIDEAQTLPDESLEEIRLLSNLETDREKLLQIVLVGQPELLAKLSLPQLRQVNQRITVRCELRPLPPREIREYVAHRLLVVSGRERPELFSLAGLRAVSRLSQGYPREINALCDRALLAAYAAGRKRVGVRLVYRAYRDLGRTPARSRRRLPAILRWALPALLLAAAAGWLALRHQTPGGRPPLPAARPAPASSRATPAPPAEPPSAAAVTPSLATTSIGGGPGPPGTASHVVAPTTLAGSPLAKGEAKGGVAPVPLRPPVAAPPDTEFSSDGRSLSASLAALSLRWKMERLAGEVRQWQFVSLKDRSLPAFFLKSGLAAAHGMEIVALPVATSSLRATDLPCLASEKSGDGYRFVVISGLQKDMVVILDPVAGRRVLPLAEWLTKVRGAFYFLVPRGAFAPAQRFGDRGPGVLGLQKQLRRTGFLRSSPGGVFGPETKAAVLALQHKHGIEADGVVGFATRLQLTRLGGQAVPSLKESP